MMQLRVSQMRVFESTLVQAFVDASTDYVLTRWPARGQQRAAVRDAVAESIERARGFGFRDRGHLTSWLDWEWEFGLQFYRETAWEWFREILENGLDPAIRVYRIENRLAVLRERGQL